jgi:rubrerythrin
MSMHHARFIVTILACAAVLLGCSQPKPVKTIDNLKAAYNGESNASAKYAKYAERATAEGLPAVAKLFEAASKAEAIHAANHKKTLEKLGATIAGPDLKPVDVKTTKENLADAIAGETHEFESMYPEFIAAAESENSADAKKSFTWALDTEKKHKNFYQAALDGLTAGTVAPAPVQWYVCPVCGNTYDEATMKAACDFCGTKKGAFIIV